VDITKEILINHSDRLFEIQDFFPQDLRQCIRTYLDQATWSDVEAWAYRRARFHCQVQGELAQQLFKFVNSAEIVGKFSALLNLNLICDAMEFWKDLPRFSMGPHLDDMTNDPWWGCQIYLGHSDQPLGTMFYSHTLELAAQLPYRDNTGYFVDRTDRVLHGVPTVPSKTFRYSIYLKYRDQR